MNDTFTPAAAASAAGDNLLLDLGRFLCYMHQGGFYTAGRTLVESEPMQRLKAAWTAETVRERDDLALRLEGVEAHRERLLEDARTRDEGQLVEAERLRAAQQLPDAPSPESHVLALSQHIGRTSCFCSENGDVCPGHELLEDLAGMLTGADTSSDYEVPDQQPSVTYEIHNHASTGYADDAIERLYETAKGVIAALDAHRAHGGQEADRG